MKGGPSGNISDLQMGDAQFEFLLRYQLTWELSWIHSSLKTNFRVP